MRIRIVNIPFLFLYCSDDVIIFYFPQTEYKFPFSMKGGSILVQAANGNEYSFTFRNTEWNFLLAESTVVAS